MKTQRSAEVSRSQGNCEFLKKSQWSAQIQEEPSWLSLNRWWFVTHGFPLGITPEVSQGSEKSEWSREKQAREDRNKVLDFEPPQALFGESGFESESCHRLPSGHNRGFFSQKGTFCL